MAIPSSWKPVNLNKIPISGEPPQGGRAFREVYGALAPNLFDALNEVLADACGKKPLPKHTSGLQQKIKEN